MPPRMRTRSAGRPAAESLGGGTGVQVGRGGRGRRPRKGNDERVDDLNGQGNDQGMGANGGVEGVNRNVEGANGGAPDFSTIIAQQLQNLLPVMLAQVSNRGNVRNQNGNVVNENVGNVIVNGNRVGYSYKEFLTCNPKEYDGKGGAAILTRWIEKMDECDMPVCDDSSSKNEGLDDIVSIPPGKEINHLDDIPDSVQSLLNRANSILFLIEEFADELAHIDPIPPGIVEADFDPEKDFRLIKKLLNDDSSPHSPKELNSEISDAIIESFSPSLIPVEDSASFIEEIDIFLVPDDSIPPGIEKDDYDSEGDVLFLKNYLTMILFPFTSMNHFTSDMGVLTTKVVDDISDNSTRELYVHVPNVLPTLPTLYPVFDTLFPFSSKNEDKVFNPGILILKEEKSPHLLSYRGFKAF
ncbi:hypothetical protein Tco_1563016 [Tanacetum coccineum]